MRVTGLGVATPRHPSRAPLPARRAFSVAVARCEAGRLVAPRGGFLRCVSDGLRSLLAPFTPIHASAGSEPALGPRLHEVAPSSLRQAAWGECPRWRTDS